jgi:hypothetical protein
MTKKKKLKSKAKRERQRTNFETLDFSLQFISRH